MLHSQPSLLLQEPEAILKSGLKHVPCKEDDDFMAEYEMMMNESQQVGRWNNSRTTSYNSSD